VAFHPFIVSAERVALSFLGSFIGATKGLSSVVFTLLVFCLPFVFSAVGSSVFIQRRVIIMSLSVNNRYILIKKAGNYINRNFFSVK